MERVAERSGRTSVGIGLEQLLVGGVLIEVDFDKVLKVPGKLTHRRRLPHLTRTPQHQRLSLASQTPILQFFVNQPPKIHIPKIQTLKLRKRIKIQINRLVCYLARKVMKNHFGPEYSPEHPGDTARTIPRLSYTSGWFHTFRLGGLCLVLKLVRDWKMIYLPYP